MWPGQSSPSWNIPPILKLCRNLLRFPHPSPAAASLLLPVPVYRGLSSSFRRFAIADGVLSDCAPCTGSHNVHILPGLLLKLVCVGVVRFLGFFLCCGRSQGKGPVCSVCLLPLCCHLGRWRPFVCFALFAVTESQAHARAGSLSWGALAEWRVCAHHFD